MVSRNLSQPSRWYSTTFRVRYQETDQMGVVYHANYLNWFECGRTEMLRQLGFTYRELENRGVFLPVTEADLQFKSPARYDDIVAVNARLTTFSALRVIYEYEIRRLSEEGTPDQLLITGSTSHVWLNKEWRPTRLDRALPELFHAITGTLREEGGAI